jgi:DNA-binding NarL/FixJ family response regulator
LRVILADDHLMVLEILTDVLTTHAAIKVSTATSLNAAFAVAEAAEHVDLIVLDYDMPGMHGFEGLRRMVGLGKAPVALLTGLVVPGMVDAVRSAGGVGLLSKSQGIREIALTMRDLANGGRFFYAPLGVAHVEVSSNLSDCQIRVMRMIEAGLRNKIIGAEMGLSLSTVKMHVRAIFKRLGAKNRTDAVRIWQNLPRVDNQAEGHRLPQDE